MFNVTAQISTIYMHSDKPSNHVVINKSGDWTVRKSGALKASRKFSTKEEATAYGIDLSRKEQTVLYVHKASGMVEHRDSFSPVADIPEVMAVTE